MNPTTESTVPDLHALKRVFAAQKNFASGNIVNMFAACSPAQLVADGWIEKVPGLGYWDGDSYKPTEKLLSTAL